MTKRETFKVGELAYLRALVNGEHPADFWAIESRVALADKIQRMITGKLK